jgi:hypothetical protein
MRHDERTAAGVEAGIVARDDERAAAVDACLAHLGMPTEPLPRVRQRSPETELLRMDEPRKRYAAMMSGLDIHYDLGEGHPLLGRRMPDSTWSPKPARSACSPCCTMPDRYCSTSVSPVPSTSL